MSDLIDREVAIDAFHKFSSDGDFVEPCEYVLRNVPSAQPRDNDYSYMGDPWEYFANTKDGDLSEVEKQIKFVMWAGYAKGKKAMREAQPAQKGGKWIKIDDDLISGRCSQCGWEAHLYEDDVFGMDYCPNCGTRLEVE